MVDFDGDMIDRYVLASAEFERRLQQVGEWASPTPCGEWNIRQLVNHVVRGKSNYIALLQGGIREDFLRLRDVDGLGNDPVGAYGRSVCEFVEAFRDPEVLRQILDYPLGEISGAQAVAVRTTDTVIHTWDLARALGVDDSLDVELVCWIDENLDAIYAGLDGMDRFFAAPTTPAADALKQERLLNRMGRSVIPE